MRTSLLRIFLKFSVFCHIQDVFLSHEKKMVGPFESQDVGKKYLHGKKAKTVRLAAERNLTNTN